MQEKVSRKGAAFISKMANELLMAPTYLMYLTILFLSMFLLNNYTNLVTFQGTDYLLVSLIFLLIYVVLGYFSLGKNFQDIIIGEDQIEIINRVPGFRKQVAVKIEDIEAVLFSESHLNLERPKVKGILQEVFRHPERKFVEIRTKNQSVRCRLYGLNQVSGYSKKPALSYEDLYAYLKLECGLPVRRFSDQAI